jgi:predicted aldo/keto reductase-like oxidoreductase
VIKLGGIMKKVKLGNTGIEVTQVGFGVLTIGYSQLNLPLDEGADILSYALEKGINFLDTAQYYKTYPYIKKAIKRSNTDVVICSKCLDSSYEEMKYAVEEARIDMDRDIIDIFLLHEVRHNHDFEKRAGAWEYLNEAKAKGIVKTIGISTHHVDVANEIINHKECDVLFPLINFNGLGIRNGDNPGNKEEMAYAIKNAANTGMGVFAMKVFGGGNLTGNYIEALDYAYNLDGISSAMIGFGNKKEVDDIINYLDGKLEKNFLPDVKHKKMNIDQGDCESCYACVERCPNLAIFINESGFAQINHYKCLTCGYCAPVCPVRAIIMF